MKSEKQLSKTCKFCGKTFHGLTEKEKFCSQACKEKYQKNYWRMKKRQKRKNSIKSSTYTLDTKNKGIYSNIENVHSSSYLKSNIYEGKKLRSETFFNSLEIKRRFSTEIKGIEIFCDKASESVYPITLRKGSNVMTLGFLETKEQAKHAVELLMSALEYMKNVWKEKEEFNSAQKEERA